jgi:hypothetical protein
VRRIRLIKDVLNELGFEHEGKGDFLDTRLTYQGADRVCNALFKLGQLTMLTKQLDMALASDDVTEWYTQQIKQRLELA